MKTSIRDNNALLMKKMLYIIGLLALSGCSDGNTDCRLSAENRIVSFSLVSGTVTYDATITDDRITVSVPYNISLADASASVVLSEAAAVRPEPATISDWDQEWLFLVTSADGENDRIYRYSVDHTDIASAGSLTLRTQREVDDFGAGGFNVVEGDLVLGGKTDTDDPIENLDRLAAIHTVRGALVVTEACRVKDLGGLSGLVSCGSLAVGAADAPHPVMQDIDIPTLEEVAGDLQIFGASLRTIHLNALQRVAGGVYIGSERLAEFMTDELTEVGGDFTLCGTLSDKSAASSPCNQLFLPKLARAGGTVTLSHFDGLSGLATSFEALHSVGGVCYEHLAKANTFELPQLENSGAIRLDDCPLLRSIVLPRLAAAASLSVEGCPAVRETNFAALERIDGDVCLRTLPGIEDFGLLFPCLASVGGDLTLDDLPSLSGTVDFSQCTFASGSMVSLRFVSVPKIEEIRGGEFGGSLTLDASPIANQPEKMPFGIIGFREVGTLRIVGFTAVETLSLPVVRCENLYIENCGSQSSFDLSLPNLSDVRGTLLLRNCGKYGAENRASFPVLEHIGRQLSLYVRGSAFSAFEFPSLETVGNGEHLSDDSSSDYAFYTMPSGCAGAFVMPKLRRVNGNMLVSTWNSTTDKTDAFEFPSLETVTGNLFIGHDRYPNRSVGSLGFPSLVEAGAIYIGNLKSVTDFSTFRRVISRLSADTWRVENCGANPTYEQMTGTDADR